MLSRQCFSQERLDQMFLEIPSTLLFCDSSVVPQGPLGILMFTTHSWHLMLENNGYKLKQVKNSVSEITRKRRADLAQIVVSLACVVLSKRG